MKIFRNLTILIFVLSLLSFELLFSSAFLMAGSKDSNMKMTKDEYEAALTAQNQIHLFIQTASKYEKNGQHERALENYLKAYAINQCAGLVAVCRGALADNYEALGEYKKALEHIEWFLSKLNPSERIYTKTVETKSRLLKKIEEQKKGERNMVEQVKQEFPKATPEEQRTFLESLGGEGVWGVFQKAMTAEHGGNFKEALAIYESLLPRKEDIIRDMKSVDGWVMLYPAIQRTSELSGDSAKEKAALLWIKDNLLDPAGEYHSSLSKLDPGTVSHLHTRIEQNKSV